MGNFINFFRLIFKKITMIKKIVIKVTYYEEMNSNSMLSRYFSIKHVNFEMNCNEKFLVKVQG